MAHRYLLTLLMVLLVASFSFYPKQKVEAADTLPVITLTVPEEQKYRDYLGLKSAAGEEFSVADIDADILLIELFSMYCPYCQEEAPRVNELFSLAEKQEEKGIRIKLIGLGASNTQFEVDYFKETFEIQFPLFPDKTLEYYKKLGGEGTPGFILCQFQKGQEPKIIMRQSGGFDDAGEFMNLLLQKAGYL